MIDKVIKHLRAKIRGIKRKMKNMCEDSLTYKQACGSINDAEDELEVLLLAKRILNQYATQNKKKK